MVRAIIFGFRLLNLFGASSSIVLGIVNFLHFLFALDSIRITSQVDLLVK